MPDTTTTRELSDEEREVVRSTRRWDLRRILGALFVVYGVIVTIIGIVNMGADEKRTGGIAINLWAGLAMLVLGILFLVWDLTRPVPVDDIVASVQAEEDKRAEGEAKAGGAAPRS